MAEVFQCVHGTSRPFNIFRIKLSIGMILTCLSVRFLECRRQKRSWVAHVPLSSLDHTLFKAHELLDEQGRTGGSGGSGAQTHLPTFDVDIAYTTLLMSAIIYERYQLDPPPLFHHACRPFKLLIRIVIRISLRMQRICTTQQ